MQNKKIKVFSMFSGIAGFEKGILNAIKDAEIIGHSEIDKYAESIYKYHYPTVKNYGDATKINPNELPDFDLLCGGFPCQSFSIAGKRGGIENDTRGTLFSEVIRIAEIKRPRIIFLENVKGLLSSNKGWDFFIILDSLVQLGNNYFGGEFSIQYEICNTKNFGLPQNRERVFIIGYFGKGCRQEIFPIGRNNNEDEKIQSEKRRTKSRTSCLSTRYGQRWSDESYIKIADYRNDEELRIREDNISPTINARAREDKHGVPLIVASRGRKGKQQLEKRNDGITNSLTSVQKDNYVIVHNMQPRNPDRPSLKYSSGGSGHLQKEDGTVYTIDTGNTNAVEFVDQVERAPLKFLKRNQKNIKGDYAFTVDGANTGGVKVNQKIRRLTPIECEKLQGFPSDWTKYGIDKNDKVIEISDAQRYKCIGNSVSVPVISAIAEKINTTI